ncbi:EAL domain-containing protein [Lysobacter psychrotolerans]|uniref:EAL domain-containing protein n=2 Tax=Montanilutibacter psychrotolerans TaxID=1327343 RepID=A0A3M8SW20_9GAMM|nr:EAL domain-containing protein [Lysobacter psychrotolerans]
MPAADVSALAWMMPLLEAVTPQAVAQAVNAALHGLPGFRGMSMLWGLDAREAPSIEPPQSIAQGHLVDDIELAREALGDEVPRLLHGSRPRLAIPLPRSEAVVLVDLDSPRHVQPFLDGAAGRLHVIDQRLRSALEIVALHGTMARLEHSEQVQRALFAISDLAGSDRDMPDLLKGIHAIVGTLMYAENFFIVGLDAEHDMIRFLYFVDVEDPLPEDVRFSEREGTLTWYLLHDGKALRGDSEQLARQASGPVRNVGTDSYDWLGVPMVRDGEVRGAVVVQSYQPGIAYSAEDEALLEFVGSHILTALDRKRNQDDLERSVQQRTLELADANRGLQLEVVERKRAERLQAALFQIAQLATADITEEAFYGSIHDVVGKLLNAKNFFIALLSDDHRQLAFPYFVDELQTNHPARPLGRSLSEYVLRHARPLLVDDRKQVEALIEQGEIEIAPDTTGPAAKSWLGVPLVLGEEAFGLVAVQSYEPSIVYGPADQELLGFVASQIANSLNRRHAAQIQQQAYAHLEERVQERTHELRKEIHERERIQDQLEHEVLHDALTGLPNRSHLRGRIERVLARLRESPHRRCGLLYLDVDRFKVINDSLGHLAGDEVLKEVARRLQECVREPDLVARLSGDEFAILLEDVDVPATAIKVAQRVLDAIGVPMQIAGKTLEPSASVGIAVGNDHYHNADELLRDADTALYRAKATGRKRYELFDETLQRSAIDVLAMEGELREALQNDRFVPHFQPIVRLDDGGLVGHEALLRWVHPVRGLLGPPDFLQVAEDSGSIEAIDWRMFELSCTLATRFPEDTYMSINVAPRHFRGDDFDVRLLAVVRDSGLAPSRLLIEVTEGSLLDNPVRVRATLDRLQAQGVGAALDDFGTGYSSLSYLHTFPLRMLKIDRTFVAALGEEGKDNSALVIAAVLALARALGMGVVAEGIESTEQRQALLALGCEFGQGHLFGRPAPIEHWLD